jgi:phage repressor protein C with HTH and peptisase S24 domain
MEPYYHRDEIIILTTLGRNPRIGDVVLLHHGNMEKIKRIIRIEPDGLYVRGDNLVASTDSRTFGLLSHSSVKARAVWPNRRPPKI